MNIEAAEFLARLASREDLRILDVRDELEYHTYNIGGLNVPLGKIREPEDLGLDTAEEIIVVCQRGVRSRTACRLLESMGFSNVRNLVGGLLALRRLNS
ncbi:MAG TPA: rhodanese-like domain-containing protein [Sphingobacteriaceae bacterium]